MKGPDGSRRGRGKVMGRAEHAMQDVAGVVRVPGWEQFAWLRHGFSTREGGVSTVYQTEAHGAQAAVRGAASEEGRNLDLNLGWTAEDAPERVEENRRRFVQAV